MPQAQANPPTHRFDDYPELNREAQWSLVAPPIELDPFGEGLRDAAHWIRDNASDQPWLTHHIAVTYFLDGEAVGEPIDVWDPTTTPELIEPGSLLVWNAKNSESVHDFSLERIDAAGWDEVADFAFGAVRVFVKQ